MSQSLQARSSACSSNTALLSMTDAAPISAAKGLRNHACVVCQRRKVKCDRMQPCSGCFKAQVACEYRDPLPPRRRKKNVQDSSMASRLQRYEDVMRRAGIEPDSIEGSAMHFPGSIRHLLSPSHEITGGTSSQATFSDTSESPGTFETGKLVTKEGRSLYLDNHLWTSVSNELGDDVDVVPNSSVDQSSPARLTGDEDRHGGFLFSGRVPPQALQRFHPNPVQIFHLWQVFLEGVNPLTKMVHAPTLQQRILEAASDLDAVSRELEALMFAIYYAALMPMHETEALRIFNIPKQDLVSRYRACAEQALVNAGVLGTSDLRVLQAFLIFLLSVRQAYDPHVLWSLSGVCTRIAQRLGLHKDGSKLGLSVYDTEIRRRTWWNLIMLDSTAGHSAGCETHLIPRADTRSPANVNDSLLHPDMKDEPIESSGATEITFVLMRIEFGAWLKKHGDGNASNFGGLWQFLDSSSVPIEQKDRLIDELQDVLERKFLRHCDPSIPTHLATILVARSVVVRSRLRAHHPRQYQAKGQTIPQAERDLLFQLCLDLAGYAEMMNTSEKTARFLWHLDSHFPWDVIIVMLSELRRRTTGDDAMNGWRLIDVAFQRQWKYSNTNKQNPLLLAVARLAIKAWRAHVAESERQQIPSLPQTDSIARFHAMYSSSVPTVDVSRLSLETSQHENLPQPATLTRETFHVPRTHPEDIELPDSHGAGLYDPVDAGLDIDFSSNSQSMGDSPMDWVQWDDLLQQSQSDH